MDDIGSTMSEDEPGAKRRKLIEDNEMIDSDVFITEFINRNCEDAIDGVVKARYTDFQVSEIDLNGDIAKISNFNIPEPKKTEINDIILHDNTIEEIEKLSTKNDFVEMDVTEVSKEHRAKIHNCVRSKFDGKYVSETVEEDGKKLILIKLNVKGNRSDRRNKWPYDHEFVHFVLYKEFIDTIQATLQLSNCLKIPSNCFSYAGVKDKRAVTTQWFSCRKLDPTILIERVNKVAKNRIMVGNICLKDTSLELGQLKGNRFHLALRNVTCDDARIQNAIKWLAENGFINYYGLQRFGKFKNASSHSIGLHLLTGRFKEACELILKNKLAAYNTDFDSFEPKSMFEKLSSFDKRSVEGILIKSLAHVNKNDFATAIEKIPRSLRLLYLHAYQSYVWNRVVSRRLSEFGLELMKGDLVECPAADNDSKILVLNEENISNFSIFDLVLPQPGFDVIYPDNVVKQWYREYLECDGLTLELDQQKLKKYNLGGSYRKAISKAENIKFNVLYYNEPSDDLIITNRDELSGRDNIISCPGGKYKAVVIEFTLHSSSYATMVLRELMKADSSVRFQKQLNSDNASVH